MELKDILDVLRKVNAEVSIKIEGKEAVSVKMVEKKIEVDIKEPELIGKILK